MRGHLAKDTCNLFVSLMRHPVLYLSNSFYFITFLPLIIKRPFVALSTFCPLRLNIASDFFVVAPVMVWMAVGVPSTIEKLNKWAIVLLSASTVLPTKAR